MVWTFTVGRGEEGWTDAPTVRQATHSSAQWPFLRRAGPAEVGFRTVALTANAENSRLIHSLSEITPVTSSRSSIGSGNSPSEIRLEAVQGQDLECLTGITGPTELQPSLMLPPSRSHRKLDLRTEQSTPNLGKL